MGKFELTLSPDYVPEWTIVEAVREFYQNAIDQGDMFHKYEHNTLIIGNKDASLTAKSLLLGNTTKAGRGDQIGNFGEGYKIATLVALRTGHPVTFYNYGQKEVWRPRFVNSKRFDSQILTFFTEKFIWSDVPDHDLTIHIDNITEDEYAQIKEGVLFLQKPGEVYETSFGQILRDPEQAGRLYVEGLFVSLSELTRGYNIKAEYVKLDRDRKMIDSFDAKWIAAQMWVDSDSPELLNLIDEDCVDIEYVGSFKYRLNEDTVESIYADFRLTHGEKAIPFRRQEQLTTILEKYEDAVPVHVTEAQYELMTLASSYAVLATPKTILTREDRLQQWIDRIGDRLTEEEIDELLHIFG